jgi:hypothetical protein
MYVILTDRKILFFDADTASGGRICGLGWCRLLLSDALRCCSVVVRCRLLSSAVGRSADFPLTSPLDP